jgi:hypothetical protein
MLYSGNSKNEFCDLLGDSWRRLADQLDIKPAEQNKFSKGEEGRDIWNLLEARGSLGKLTQALQAIDRSDLIAILEQRRQEDYREYFQGRIDQWSQ